MSISRKGVEGLQRVFPDDMVSGFYIQKTTQTPALSVRSVSSGSMNKAVRITNVSSTAAM